MNIYVFETKSEIDDSELKKYFGSKGKKMRKFQYFKKLLFLMDTHAKISQNIFAKSFVSEHSKHLFFILRDKLAFFSGGGWTLSLVDPSAKNTMFFSCSLLPSNILQSTLFPSCPSSTPSNCVINYIRKDTPKNSGFLSGRTI